MHMLKVLAGLCAFQGLPDMWQQALSKSKRPRKRLHKFE